ncbi:hypothetical protein STRPO_1551 [Streptococcus porcinus str. Jelinkova 176]|uniref:Uncharacterized protein n=1 Tax=Streptococcus porcinus str. Jelinkova 176 TaxID=873448 RepID=A0ABP2L0Y4_STRPO|nr:hypothetical protein STRPO_1551 [Streptococcus porcinus str. Jelinkova 176]
MHRSRQVRFLSNLSAVFILEVRRLKNLFYDSLSSVIKSFKKAPRTWDARLMTERLECESDGPF